MQEPCVVANDEYCFIHPVFDRTALSRTVKMMQARYFLHDSLFLPFPHVPADIRFTAITPADTGNYYFVVADSRYRLVLDAGEHCNAPSLGKSSRAD
jgi:hypothetical protein